MACNTVIETWMTARDGVKLYTRLQLPEAEAGNAPAGCEGLQY